LTARWILPVDSAPLEGGILTIHGDRLVGVSARRAAGANVDLGDVAVLPGLVNAHTHLDLSDLRGCVPPTPDLPAWLRSVVQHRLQRSANQVEPAIEAGLAESLRFGTTLLGDISTGGLSWPVLVQAPMRAVVFYELLGLSKSRARQTWRDTRAWLATHSATPTCRIGLSPHAPYSVRASLFRAATQLAARHKLPISIHLAESAVELQLLDEQTGPFVDFLKERGVWDADGLVSSVEALLRLHAGLANVLLVHGSFLDPAYPLPSCSSIVYCPRTHAAFGHPKHPVQDFLQAGIRVALGTDSLASNPDLDVLAEARYLHEQFPGIPASTILCMATLWGADALGWEEETGSLSPGKSADLVCVPLDGGEGDPYDAILRSCLPVRAVMFRGSWITEITDPPAPASGERT
jgi:cytosine/adenosine deaminase-related metal-dependent hydrolase